MKILAVDYGDSRTGLATCDRTEFLTTAITPQITLKARNKVAARVCEVAKEIEAEMILIGLPLNMDGTEGERAAKSRKDMLGQTGKGIAFHHAGKSIAQFPVDAALRAGSELFRHQKDAAPACLGPGTDAGIEQRRFAAAGAA